MNLIIRILGIVLTLVIIAAAILLLLPVLNIIPLTDLGLPNWLNQLIGPLIESSWRLLFGGVLSAVLLLGIILLYLELRTLFAREPRVLILKDDLGKVELAESCIGSMIEYEARLFEQISSIKSRIVHKKDGTLIKSVIFVKPETKIEGISQNLRDRITDRLENQLGVQISGLTITAETAPAVKSSKRVMK